MYRNKRPTSFFAKAPKFIANRTCIGNTGPIGHVLNLAAHLAAQFPIVLAGLYYHNWHPANIPSHEHRKTDFLWSVEQGLEKIACNVSAAEGITAVYALLEKRLSPGLIQKIKQAFPQ